jgi:hypothetical protein
VFNESTDIDIASSIGEASRVEAANECLLVMAEDELEEERQARHAVEGEREVLQRFSVAAVLSNAAAVQSDLEARKSELKTMKSALKSVESEKESRLKVVESEKEKRRLEDLLEDLLEKSNLEARQSDNELIEILEMKLRTTMKLQTRKLRELLEMEKQNEMKLTELLEMEKQNEMKFWDLVVATVGVICCVVLLAKWKSIDPEFGTSPCLYCDL